MISIIVGILFICFSIFACLPFGPLNWSKEVIAFLKGSLPVVSLFIAFICVFVGAADIKDKKEAKQEEALEEENSSKES